jgi:histidinol phosphatase-like enzyme (inositol monophosphatase family)
MSAPEDLVFFNRLADAASAAIMPHFRAALTAAEHKGDGDRFDPVTVADRNAEAAIRDLITAHFPADGIFGEEFGNERLTADRVWYIDPIDGTRAFIAGVPVWGTLIGLYDGGRPVLGMMAQHFSGERYFGDAGHAWYEGPGGPRELKTRACPTLPEAVLFTTDPKLFSAVEKPRYDNVEALVRLARYGCDCYAYCMLAAGLVDIVIEAGLQPYDIMPLVPVIEGAGGVVTDWQGNRVTGGGAIIAAGDPRLHAAALELLRDPVAL